MMRVNHRKRLPVQKVDNVWMTQALKHFNLLVNHIFMALDSLLEYDLDSDFLVSTARRGPLDGTICTRALLPDECDVR